MARLAYRREGLAQRSIAGTSRWRASTLGIALATASLGGCSESVELPPFQQAPGLARVLDNGGPAGDTGWWPSMAADADGTAHMSYCDSYHGDLIYAQRAPGGGWKTETVVSRGAVGKYTALGINPQGEIAIAFYDQDTKYLRYAWRGKAKEQGNGVEAGDNGWLTERVAWGLEIGMAAELRFDQHGTAHLLYYIPSGKLVHARRPVGGQWEKTPIADATGSFTIRIDAQVRGETLWVTFVHWTFKDLFLYLAKIPVGGGPAQIETIDTEAGPGWRSQLLFEGDQPRVLYTRSRKPQLRWARPGPEGWVNELLLPDVANFAAARAPSGEILVAYEDVMGSVSGQGVIRYLSARPAGDKLVSQRYRWDPDGPTGQYLDMILDSHNRPLIAYYAGPIHGIKIYEEEGPSPASPRAPR